MEEIWKPIAETNGRYEVSNLGRVRSTDYDVGHRWGGKAKKRGRVLKPRPDKDGYLCVAWYIDRKCRNAKIHRIVAQHFLPPSDLPEVNHKDLDKTNNVHTNLEWSTRKSNQEHASGSRVFSALKNPRRAKKLNADIVMAIRHAREAGKTYAEIASEFGISAPTALKIVRGDIWS